MWYVHHVCGRPGSCPCCPFWGVQIKEYSRLCAASCNYRGQDTVSDLCNLLLNLLDNNVCLCVCASDVGWLLLWFVAPCVFVLLIVNGSLGAQLCKSFCFSLECLFFSVLCCCFFFFSGVYRLFFAMQLLPVVSPFPLRHSTCLTKFYFVLSK